MRKFLILCVFALFVVGVSNAADEVKPSSTIESYCVEKSVDDYETQRLCVKKITEGQRAVTTLREHFAEDSEEYRIIERSVAKWFPRFDWVVERAQQQIDALNMIQSHHAGEGVALDACRQLWPGDFVMQRYCLQAKKQQ